MLDELTDAPIEGSAFIRHFSEPFERAASAELVYATTFVDPYLGWYKSTSRRSHFPFLITKNPVEPNIDNYAANIYKMVNNYEDLLFCRSHPGDEAIRLVYSAHAINHSLRSRKLVIKNNEREQKSGFSDSLRDQGFHRARTLILAPTKEAARRIVHTILTLMPAGSTVSHRRRFEVDFGPRPGETDKEKRKGRKPKDYEEWFSNNTCDHFRIGISFSKKSVKLYSAFSDSDLILASPLGLQTIIDDEKEKEADLQYATASIELLIIDQAEMLLMQNWSNVQRIVSLLNQRPTNAEFASSTRIRLAYLAGYGRRYRQTLIFSAVEAPQITLLTAECENFQGLNFFPSTPLFEDSYPSYLCDATHSPEARRIRLWVSGGYRTADLLTGGLTRLRDAPDVSVNLIPFAVSGQLLSKLGHLYDAGDSTDVDSGDDVDCMPTPKDELPTSVVCPHQTSTSVARISCTDLTYMTGRSVPIARMDTFKARVLPRLRRGTDQRVLIYVPDFYDLEELRFVLSSESLDFCCVHEYLADAEAERFRTLFSLGRIRIIVVSERYYFFKRRKIRGAQNFVFFGPPTFPWFLKEFIGCRHKANERLDESQPPHLTVIYFPPFEAHVLSALTGRVDL